MTSFAAIQLCERLPALGFIVYIVKGVAVSSRCDRTLPGLAPSLSGDQTGNRRRLKMKLQ
jgi:hypothetical protein